MHGGYGCRCNTLRLVEEHFVTATEEVDKEEDS